MQGTGGNTKFFSEIFGFEMFVRILYLVYRFFGEYVCKLLKSNWKKMGTSSRIEDILKKDGERNGKSMEVETELRSKRLGNP